MSDLESLSALLIGLSGVLGLLCALTAAFCESSGNFWGSGALKTGCGLEGRGIGAWGPLHAIKRGFGRRCAIHAHPMP